LRLGQGAPTLFDIAIGHRPVNLIKVDGVDAQPPQARLTLTANRVGLQSTADLARFIPHARALREYVRPDGSPSQRARHHFFRMAQAVDRGGIDPIDAVVERRVDRRHGLRVILWANFHPPPPIAHAPTPMGVNSISLFPNRFFVMAPSMIVRPSTRPSSVSC
jgi:hypothetical protein